MSIVVVILGILAVVALVIWYRRWRARKAVEIIIGHPAALLFELARVDGPVNEAERKYIAGYALAAFDLLLTKSSVSINPFWLEGIMRTADNPLSDAAKEDYLRYLSQSMRGSRNFFEICCALADVDGAMQWREREWLEMQGTFSMLDVHWFMNFLEKKCPCSKHPAAIKANIT